MYFKNLYCKSIIFLLLIYFQNVFGDRATEKYKLQFSKEKVDYPTAINNCKKKDMRLVEIEYKRKNDAIFDHLKKNDDKSLFWTNGRRTTNPAKTNVEKSDIVYPFRWASNGHRLSFRNFISGHPNNVAPLRLSPTVIAINNNGNDVVWNDVRIYRMKHKYICEPDIKSNKEAPTEPENPYGFVFTGHVFNSYGFEKNLNHCYEMDGTKKKPIKLDSKEKCDSLLKILKADDNRIQFFLPAKREDESSPYKWINGSDVSYANWATDQPSKSKDELCVLFNYDPAKDQVVWKSTGCDDNRRVACENA